MKTFCCVNHGLSMYFEVNDAGELKLNHCGLDDYTKIFDYVKPFQSEDFRAAEVQISGGHHDCGHGTKNMGTSEGRTLKYVSHEETENQLGKHLSILLRNNNIELQQNYQFYSSCHVISSNCIVKNIAGKDLPLEYVSSFFLFGLGKKSTSDPYDDIELTVSVNASYRENQWKKYLLSDFGFVPSSRYSTTCQKVCFSNTGSWSSKQNLPMAFIREKTTNQFMLWQIENNGSWSWEIGDYNSCLYLGLSGPNLSENQWIKVLKPGESFSSVSAALSFSSTSQDDMFGQMTKYRRAVRRPNQDDIDLPIVYNPYMHDSGESPNEQNILAAIEGVKDIGADYFCLDAGWHDDQEDYWKAIGDWRQSTTRFPSGISSVFQKIKDCNMKPGLWVEIEMVGFYNDSKQKIPLDNFFCRHGGVISNLGRLNLDFSNPQVIEHINKIMQYITDNYDPKYIKIDYNADVGAGTDVNSDSLGDGLLKHNRAYIAWLSEFIADHPDIVVENCSCGGLRLDGQMLRLCSINSTSDQTDYLRYPYIASNMLTNGTPEQMAVWCYPLKDASYEAVIMNMVNSMLGRVHLSGHTPYLSEEMKSVVKDGLSYYRSMTEMKVTALPFWPLGLNEFGSDTVACGIYKDKKAYLAVWNLGEDKSVSLPIHIGTIKNAQVGFPRSSQNNITVDIESNSVVLAMGKKQARIIEIHLL